MTKLAHVGIPTTFEQKGEVYNDGLKVYLTMPEDSEFAFEYLRFVPGTPLPEVLTKQNRVAYIVVDLEAAMKQGEVIVEPMYVDEHLSIAFIMIDGLPVELMWQH